MADTDQTNTTEDNKADLPPLTDEIFADLLDESFSGSERLTGRVVSGLVIEVENDLVLIDVGLKSEGSISIREFRDASGEIDINAGDKIDVFVERFEDKDGVVMLSRDKARREEAWTVLEVAFERRPLLSRSLRRSIASCQRPSARSTSASFSLA